MVKCDIGLIVDINKEEAAIYYKNAADKGNKMKYLLRIV